MLLSVVLPCFNEAEGIAAAVATAGEAARVAAAAGDVTAWEVVVVDDGSTDDTATILAALASEDPTLRVVTSPVNRGLGATIRAGLAAATGDVVLYTDADLPCDLVQDLAKALRLMRVYDADVVAAYRHDRTSEGPRRAVYSVVYNVFVRTVFKLRLRDVNFAFKLMRRCVVDAVDLASEGSFIDVELLLQAERAGFKIIQFGVDYFPRTRGISTLSSAGTVATIVREMATVGRSAARDATPPLVDGGGAARRPLVVNADDYGLTAGVSRGILQAHVQGIVTSTSVLVLGRGFEESSRWLADVASLEAGIHLAAVGEDPPILSAREVPSLVDRRGRLRTSWRSFLSAACRGGIDVDDLEREFAAQLEAARGSGLVLSHVDTHQHLHLWPSVSEVVVRLARANGIGAIRVPRSAAPLKKVGINRLADSLTAKATAAGLATPAWAAGLDEAGQMHGLRFVNALRLVSAGAHGSAEIGCHPGHAADARATYRWGYDWDDELAWLTSADARAAVDRAGFFLAGYRSLPSPVPSA
ncbi:MAG: ChbG/HpnK family deacetylase [Actinomycetota bacterium]|nr:ChbG/HpnK family deacetylase [Actinomycetota bacterium]